jgi:hypothetical protein
MILNSLLPEDCQENNTPIMSKFGLLIILLLIAGKNFAQDYFVLIQADNKQSFYVRLGDRSLPSSSEGTLILSQLKDSTYNIVVGFSGQGIAEQTFTVELHHKDQQFLLKEQDRNWVLYSPLTGETRTPNPKEGKANELQPQGVKKDDAFSRLMAGVVRDTAVMYNTYAMEPTFNDSQVKAGLRPADSANMATTPANPLANAQANTQAAIPVSINPDTVKNSPVHEGVIRHTLDSSIASPTVAHFDTDSSGTSHTFVRTTPADSTATSRPRLNPAPADPSSSVSVNVPHRPDILKLSQRKMPHSLRLAFADHTPGKKVDTVIIFIMMDTVSSNTTRPAATASSATASSATASSASTPSTNIAVPPATIAHPTDTTRHAAVRAAGPNPEAPNSSAAIGASSPGEGSGKVRPDTVQKRSNVKTPLPFVNSDCHDLATDYDVDKLRVKMLESSKDEDRFRVAGKAFKVKCYSTRHLKALSEVFTTDASKFRFYETAYPFAADDHFRELGSTLADPVYNSKFKAMTGQ